MINFYSNSMTKAVLTFSLLILLFYSSTAQTEKDYKKLNKAKDDFIKALNFTFPHERSSHKSAIFNVNSLIEKYPQWAEPYVILAHYERNSKERNKILKKAYENGLSNDFTIVHEYGKALTSSALNWISDIKYAIKINEEAISLDASQFNNHYALANAYSEIYRFSPNNTFDNWYNMYKNYSLANIDCVDRFKGYNMYERAKVNPSSGEIVYYDPEYNNLSTMDTVLYNKKKKFSSMFLHGGIYAAKTSEDKYVYFKIYKEGLFMSYIADEVKEPIKMQGVLKHENYIEANFGMQGSLVVDNEGKIRSSKLLCLHRENYMIFDKIEILDYGKKVKATVKYYTGNGDLYQERNLTFDYYDFSKPECKIGDCVNGSGEYYYGNGKSYIGTFKNGKRHGYGILSEGLNYDYSGEWVNDKKHGYGTERDESYNFAIFVGGRAGFWENNEYCCREPCKVCREKKISNTEKRKNGYRIIQGRPVVILGTLESPYLMISDGGLIESNVCTKTYSVVIKDANGKTKSSTDPYNDSFGLEYFTYPINVKISYEISCFSNNKNVVEVDILEPGDWNLNIPIW